MNRGIMRRVQKRTDCIVMISKVLKSKLCLVSFQLLRYQSSHFLPLPPDNTNSIQEGAVSFVCKMNEMQDIEIPMYF